MPHPDPAISHPPGVPRTTASDTPDAIGAVVQLLRAHEARLTALEARGPDLATVAAPRVEVLTADALSQAILHNPRGCEPAYDYALKLVRHLGRVAVPSRVVEESVVSPPAPVRAGEEGR